MHTYVYIYNIFDTGYSIFDITWCVPDTMYLIFDIICQTCDTLYDMF